MSFTIIQIIINQLSNSHRETIIIIIQTNINLFPLYAPGLPIIILGFLSQFVLMLKDKKTRTSWWSFCTWYCCCKCTASPSL